MALRRSVAIVAIQSIGGGPVRESRPHYRQLIFLSYNGTPSRCVLSIYHISRNVAYRCLRTRNNCPKSVQNYTLQHCLDVPRSL
ncbi:hypothetical protein SDC9_199969 [bioreactor metagenome]|uniref:Uncharacterized protein n=1 Tax=bioreactor metagenome TaxID=1076179 RepID=A0A645IYL8_9ZZZZ